MSSYNRNPDILVKMIKVLKRLIFKNDTWKLNTFAKSCIQWVNEQRKCCEVELMESVKCQEGIQLGNLLGYMVESIP